MTPDTDSASGKCAHLLATACEFHYQQARDHREAASLLLALWGAHDWEALEHEGFLPPGSAAAIRAEDAANYEAAARRQE